ncbi:No apical meristem (NAM) protein [Corchorus olitorius]|uniref:No apical meristem (NAM) protein n=1 Tax=Corchorus olitorius TaxID=93759 RepID=A0A1R3H3Y5_9ROSI|nr:No apical meristem (NAM) protein [Corchorus olitorius]
MLRYSPDDLGTLPPGFVFQPTEQQILKYYVRPAVETGCLPNFMTSCDLYTSEPWNLFDKNFAGYFWIYTPLKNKRIVVSGEHKEKNPRRKKKKEEQEINCEYIQRRAGCGYWNGRTAPKEIRDSDGKFLGRYKYFTYKYNEDLSGNNGKWVMHEYSLAEAEGLNNAALCKIQCKPSVKSKKRQGKPQTMSVNPTPQKKARGDDHNEETKCDGDPDEFLRAILLENPSPPHVDEIEPQEDSGQVANFTDTNPNDLETFGKTVVWDDLQIIEPLDKVGSDECSAVEAWFV